MFDETERGIPIEILLVEDNDGDIVLTQEAFKESKLINFLFFWRVYVLSL